MRGVFIILIAITLVPITRTSNNFKSKPENSIRSNLIDKPISQEFPTKYEAHEEFLPIKPSSRKKKSKKNSVERYRQLERKALKEKFGGDLGSCLFKHESTLVREQILEHEFPEFSVQTNSIKETKRVQTEALLKSFGGDLDISLKRHESLLERDKRLASEQDYPKDPETPLSTRRRLQSELSLMDKFGGELGSILKKHECGLERDIRLARESAAANPESSEYSQEYSSSHSDEDDHKLGHSPPPAKAPSGRASTNSPSPAAEEQAMDSAEGQGVDCEYGAARHSARLEEEEEVHYGQPPALSDEEYEPGDAADDGLWCAPSPGK